ncbi:cytidyltransferase-like protein [Rhodopirellula rubra]|uniref:Cytidyltransferase-like protein n=1 Tax=Aporhodopirellula rubra TaxID=980271 RepID=A0A7W5E118_9BACT|nr:adenylyltransferase/cytidyltransferase family protein [Aporhodopirellula rubra]MBB3207814.1 cytidyltransferase-like protein [Aporhodopirellula rubra]
MKKVLLCGSFDLFHIGHFTVIEKASAQGDFLTVGVHQDSENMKEVDYFYSPEERKRIIKSLRFVDEVILYERMEELVRQIDFDVLCHGPDNVAPRFQRIFAWCREHGRSVVELPRTEGISSTAIRRFITRTISPSTHGQLPSSDKKVA